jgi:hypothetical protein
MFDPFDLENIILWRFSVMGFKAMHAVCAVILLPNVVQHLCKIFIIHYLHLICYLYVLNHQCIQKAWQEKYRVSKIVYWLYLMKTTKLTILRGQCLMWTNNISHCCLSGKDVSWLVNNKKVITFSVNYFYCGIWKFITTLKVELTYNLFLWHVHGAV